MNQNLSKTLFSRRIKISFVLMGISSFLMFFGFHFPMIGYLDWDTGSVLVGLGNGLFIIGMIMLYLQFHKSVKMKN